MYANTFAYIEDFSGSIEVISSKGSRVILPGIIGREINSGDIVKVYEGSHCDISSEDNRTFIRLDEKSEMKFIVTDKTREMSLNYGSAYLHHTHNNFKKKTFLFSNHSQIYLTNSELWLSLNDIKVDKIYSFGRELNISDKFKGIRKKISQTNMIHSSGDDIKIITGEGFKSIIPDYIFNTFTKKEYTINDSLLFNLGQSDLIPRYYANVNTSDFDNLESNNFGFSLSSGSSYLYDGQYANLAVQAYYSKGNIEAMINLDEYIPVNNPSLTINDWLNMETLLSKLSYLSISNNKKTIFLNGGRLKSLTFGHGQLLYNYSNSYNYPIMQRTGLFMHISPLNKKSYLIDFFVSDISQIFNGGGLFGMHSSLFLSKFFPLTIGYGYVVDLDQYSEYDSNISIDSEISASEIDLEYIVSQSRERKVSIISELDAIFFPYELRYSRVDDNPASSFKTRKGTWGSMFGGKVVYESGHEISLSAHYNDALYTPYYFSSTYDFEKVRTIAYNDNISSHKLNNKDNEDFLIDFCDHLGSNDDEFPSDCDNGEILYLSKELYPLFSSTDFVYSMIGGSIKYDYNYYNIRGVSFSAMYLFDNNSDSNNSYYLISAEMFYNGDFWFERLDNLKFYFHRNFANISSDNNGSENMMAGIGFDFEITSVLNFHFDWQNVFYDIDSDADVDKINSYTIEFKYDLIK